MTSRWLPSFLLERTPNEPVEEVKNTADSSSTVIDVLEPGSSGQAVDQPCAFCSTVTPLVNSKDVGGSNPKEDNKEISIFDYQANPTDPNEVSFKTCDTFEVIEKVGFWWIVKDESGKQGIVPSNCFGPRVIDKGTAIYDYDANSEDPTEVSFKKGDVFEITKNDGKWWTVKVTDGERIVPSNYIASEKAKARRRFNQVSTISQGEQSGETPINVTEPEEVEKPEAPTSEDLPFPYRARALYDYHASADDPNEFCFKKGDILEIFDKSGRWWSAKDPTGDLKIAPSNYLKLL